LNLNKKEDIQRKIRDLSQVINTFEVINIPKAVKTLKVKRTNDEVICSHCGKIVKNFQALGGHMAKIHKRSDKTTKYLLSGLRFGVEKIRESSMDHNDQNEQNRLSDLISSELSKSNEGMIE